MNAQNVGITWCMLGYGAESPWLLRDCLINGASAIWPDMPESLPAALAAWPAGVNAVVVVALPTAPIWPNCCKRSVRTGICLS